jgi:hypothetical protein
MPQARKLRLRRLTRTVPEGEKVLALLAREAPRLIRAADSGIPPVSAVSAKLYQLFPTATRSVSFRQFVGIAVKAVLEDHGFAVEKAGIKLRGDKVFVTGSSYRRLPMPEIRSTEQSLLSRLLGVMTPAEKDELRQLLAE